MNSNKKMPAKEISIEKSKQDKLFYFVANAVVYRELDGRCLLLRRSSKEKVHPGKYATPGGKMEWGDFNLDKPTRMNGEVIDFEDSIEKLLMREIFEEAGIEVHPDMQYINSVTFVRPDGIPVVLVKFAMRYKEGEVKLEEGAFDDFVWVDEKEVKKYNCIAGVDREVQKAIKIFTKNKKQKNENTKRH